MVENKQIIAAFPERQRIINASEKSNLTEMVHCLKGDLSRLRKIGFRADGAHKQIKEWQWVVVCYELNPLTVPKMRSSTKPVAPHFIVLKDSKETFGKVSSLCLEGCGS